MTRPALNPAPDQPEYLEKLEMLPPHMQGAVRCYIENGIPPGSFLSAVLTNNLQAAFFRADDVNQHVIGSYVNYLYAYALGVCHGSPERVEAWIKRGGLSGQEAAK